MKLGIVVVYRVAERNEMLLDVHLRQIEKNTQVPYAIYGSAEGLPPRFRGKLENSPRVRLCDVTPYDGTHTHDRRRYEHSFYLEQLIKAAIADDVSHVCVLHVDSFPVRFGWAQHLAEQLSGGCVLAAIQRDDERDQKPMSACIFFRRDFYLEESPRLLLTESELASERYRQYAQAYPHSTDSGAGYGFRVFDRGLSWHALRRSNRVGRDGIFGAVYGDLVFHLGAALQIENSPLLVYRSKGQSVKSPFRRFLGSVADSVLPFRVRDTLKRHLLNRVVRSGQELERRAFERVRQELFRDPERFIESLRRSERR